MMQARIVLNPSLLLFPDGWTVNQAPSQFDESLLEGVRSGDSDAWAELVSEFQGRLTAFARRRVGQHADADDVVQETFLSLLKSLKSFRGESSLETWLFQLLRRRIADAHRRAGRSEQISLCLSGVQNDRTDGTPADRQVLATDQSASWYVRQQEQLRRDRMELHRAVIASTDRLKAASRFRDLKAFDLLFFAHWKNQDIARELDLEETAVAVLKHRYIQRICQHLPDNEQPDPDGLRCAELLTDVWREGRPSCPKRTTLGKFLLGTLAEDWDDFVAFHVERLGCVYCVANLDDISARINSGNDDSCTELRGRIMESTIGFLNRSDSQPSDQ